VTNEEAIRTSYLESEGPLPLVIEPKESGFDLTTWTRDSRDYIETQLLKHGAILFRDFNITSTAGFEKLARALVPQLFEYHERSSPRTEISTGVYTSTNHPANQPIRFHNEHSYSHRWPMKIWFFCLQPAASGGATPIADGRKIFQLIDPKIRKRFIEKRVKYVRNYGDGFGLPWQTAFQTTNKSDVDEYCRKASIQAEWRDGGRLRTTQIFRTIIPHQKTGEMVWFEHTAFFHITTLDPVLCEAFLADYQEEDLPFNTYYGDGSPIENSVLEAIREAYEQAAVSFQWRSKDVLLIDNVLTAHSREPYSGARKILVAMGEIFFADDVNDEAILAYEKESVAAVPAG
jgi:alpha-ketoglutarate-dependent taurine dioxygenase